MIYAFFGFAIPTLTIIMVSVIRMAYMVKSITASLEEIKEALKK